MPILEAAEDTEGEIGNGPAQLKIMAIGESSIAGVGARSGRKGLVGSTARSLAELLNAQISWKTFAKSGLTIKEVTRTLVPLSIKEKPDLLLVGVGANDVFKLNHPFGFERDLKELISQLRQRFADVPMLFVHMPPIKELPIWPRPLGFFLGRLGGLFEEQMQNVISQYDKVYYCEKPITLRGFMARMGRPAQIKEFFSDGVHPSELTYQLWGEVISSFIREKILKA